MATHKIKCWPEYFESLENGAKKFEFRQNDRNYQVGDILVIQEYLQHKMCYTGRELFFEVTYILHGQSIAGMRDNYCIMSIKKI